MNIDPNKRLMYHTHPSSKDRYVSPPSEIDIATLFNNSVNANISITSSSIFSKEGNLCNFIVHPTNYKTRVNQTEKKLKKMMNLRKRNNKIFFPLQEYIPRFKELPIRFIFKF
jgi:hypothetical protein